MTNDQIEAIAELTGRHAAERFKFNATTSAALSEMEERQKGEARELAAQLGLPDPTLPAPPPPVNMGAVDPPADSPPGVPVPYERPTLAPITPVPRPLRLRK